MSNLEKIDEIEYGDTPARVKKWFEDRIREGKHKVYVARGWCKRCGICISFCPVKALDADNEGVPIVFDKACVSCGMCELLCPDYAIVVAGLKGQGNSKNGRGEDNNERK